MKQWKLLPVFLLLVVLLGALAVPAGAVSGSDLCYKYTPQMTDNTFRYLQEIYIEKYPQMGLRWTQGTEKDKQVLQRLADIITEGCTTDEQKAEAIAGWIKRNIEYEEGSGAFYAIDVFYARKGNCASYAQLMQTLLRLKGVKAVYSDGFRMDTQITTVAQKREFQSGHAWCFAYVGGQWKLYDPLWEGSRGLTDRDYISKNYMIESVDVITPVYDSQEIPPIQNPDMAKLYINGRFMYYRDGEPNPEICNHNYGINMTAHYCFSICNTYYDNPDETQTMLYLDEPDRMKDILPGEFYRDGWISYRGGCMDLKYAYENGVQAHGIVMERDGVRYFMHQSKAYRLLLEEGQYTIRNGFISVEPGFSGKIMEPCWYQEYKDDPEYRITWRVDEGSSVTVDQNGVITCMQEEEETPVIWVELHHIYPDGSTALTSAEVIWVGFWEDDRVADYTDHLPHECSYTVKERVEGNCFQGGYTVYACSCGNEYTQNDTAPLGHSFGDWTILIEPTATQDGSLARRCSRCGWEEYQSVPAGSNPSDYPAFPENPDDPSGGGEHTCQWVAVEVVPAWCDAEGYTVYACSLCGIEKVDDFTPAGHRYGPWEVWQEPDEYNSGFRIRYCEMCGIDQGQEIPAGSGGQMPPDPTDPPQPTHPVTPDPAPTRPAGPGDIWLDAEGDSNISVLFPGADPEQLTGVTVQAEEVQMDPEVVMQLKGFLENNTAPVAQLQLVDITLMAGGHIIQPDGIVVVQMPLPDPSWASNQLAAYHIGENGELNSLQVDLSEDGQSALFVVEHFSYYALVLHGNGENADDPSNPGGPANPGSPVNPGDPSTPGASGNPEADILPWVLVAVLLVVIIVGTIVVIILFKKRK